MSDDLQCTRCGQRGHLAKDCPWPAAAIKRLHAAQNAGRKRQRGAMIGMDGLPALKAALGEALRTRVLRSSRW